MSSLDFTNLVANLYCEVAKQKADILIDSGKDKSGKLKKNTYTQIRKFYDEISMREEETRKQPEKYRSVLPFILMIRAKAAYAEGRGLVTKEFTNLLNECFQEKTIPTPEAFRNCKLFFEAIMAYLRAQSK